MIKRLLKKCYSGDFAAASAAISAAQSDATGGVVGAGSAAAGSAPSSADLAQIQSLSLGSTGSDGGSDSAGDTARKGGNGGTAEYEAQNDSDSAIMLEDHLTEVRRRSVGVIIRYTSINCVFSFPFSRSA